MLRSILLAVAIGVLGCGTPADKGAGAAASPPSCRASGAGVSRCGPDGGSCCESPAVPGGTFYRSYDGVSALYMSQAYPATVAAFRLDRYEVTVGRFRAFVAAVVGGWLPAAGSGKHTHLNGGEGLASGAMPSGYEAGWDSTWSATFATTESDWTRSLQCFPQLETWTQSPGANESLPITCLTWYEAYAFCIWDGGFLPSEAEWNFAAAGGPEQRSYPWSVPPQSMTIDCAHANFIDTAPCVSPPNGSTNAVGSESPAGDGKWGQADLAGNAWEWMLDYYDAYGGPITNAADLTPNQFRVIRGGAFDYHDTNLLTSFRYDFDPTTRNSDQGVRCARAP